MSSQRTPPSSNPAPRPPPGAPPPLRGGSPPHAAIGPTLMFVLARALAAAQAAVLLTVVLITIGGVVIARVVIAMYATVAVLVARTIDRFRRRAAGAARRRWIWGVPLLDRTLPAVTAWAFLALRRVTMRERHSIGRFHGTLIPQAYRQPADDRAPRTIALLRDPATWRDLAYWLTAIPVTLVAVAVLAAAWLALPAVGIALLTVANDAIGPPGAPAEWVSIPTGTIAVIVGIAVASALLAPAATRVAASAYVTLGEAWLNPGEQMRLQAELEEQRMRRRLMIEAAEAERRRIERDLHDGAQQRLVSLAMTLGMARERFAADPASAGQLVAEAHDEVKLALGDLRTLARGLHPAVLTDRGLDAALSGLAGRAGVPVEVDVRTAGRLPNSIESAAYFVVAEALTNVTRHAAATQARVSVVGEGDRVVVEIADDGVGGADPSRGTGLAGLAGRIEAIDGHLTIDSPMGGPTVIRAELPCAS